MLKELPSLKGKSCNCYNRFLFEYQKRTGVQLFYTYIYIKAQHLLGFYIYVGKPLDPKLIR